MKGPLHLPLLGSGLSYKRPPIEINGEQVMNLAGNGFYSCKFTLERSGTRVGEIYEAPGFRVIKKRFFMDLPDELSNEMKLFVFFLAVNRAFR